MKVSIKMIVLSLVITQTQQRQLQLQFHKGIRTCCGRICRPVLYKQIKISTTASTMTSTAFITTSSVPLFGNVRTATTTKSKNKLIPFITTTTNTLQEQRRSSSHDARDVNDNNDNDGNKMKRSLRPPIAPYLYRNNRSPVSRSSSQGSDNNNNFNTDRDAFQDGLFVLGQAEMEQNDENADRDKAFDLFDCVPPKQIDFRTGLPIMVEVISFGPLGASVAIIGKGHKVTKDTPLVDSSTPYALGLIYQNEIAIFRELRSNIDIVIGEVLPAYVERVRAYDGKIDVSLRVIGGRAKVDKWSATVLKRLNEYENGEIPLGNKSSPQDIAQEFPGMSKLDFKKCVGALFERQLVYPFAYCTKRYEDGLQIVKAVKAVELIKERSGAIQDNNTATTKPFSSPMTKVAQETLNYRRGAVARNPNYNSKYHTPNRRRRDDYNDNLPSSSPASRQGYAGNNMNNSNSDSNSNADNIN